MWAEEDFDAAGLIVLQSLQSHTEPTKNRVYKMYHGTSKKAAEDICKMGFHPSSDGMFGPGVYLSRDLQKASRYPLKLAENQKVVLLVKVNVGKVIAITRQHHPLQKTWHDHGYDTAWCPPNCGMVPSGLEEDCVWDPKRIKVIDVIPSCLERHTAPASGEVYRMFYGTSREAAAKIKKEGFCQSYGMLGPGVYLSRDLQNAVNATVGLPEDSKVVLIVRVNVGNVITIIPFHPLQMTWRSYGFDTAWAQTFGMPSNVDCIWDPKQITVVDVIHLK